MTDILKKYWWAVATIISAPVVINFVLQIPAFVQIVGDNTDWLIFWGNYLGGSISALATLFVLFKTLQQNHEENEKNRTANEEANEKNRIAIEQENKANRELQIRVIRHQQENQWLDKFREVAGEYIKIYNFNNLVDVRNTILKDPQCAYRQLKDMYDQTTVLDAKFAYIRKSSREPDDFTQFISNSHIAFDNTLDDLQYIICYIIECNGKYMSASGFLNYIQNNIKKNISDKMLSIIQKHDDNRFIDINKWHNIIGERINSILDLSNNVRDRICKYIDLEQTRIDQILEE